MKFIDLAHIRVRSGKGGPGSVSFRREKYVPRGGPDGGDGGRGADVILRAKGNMNTLLDFRYLDHYDAENGQPGMGRERKGRDGETLELPVPVGTVVTDRETGEVVADLVDADQAIVVARGGRGGKGNTHFKSSVRQAPRHAQPGEPGQERNLTLELKLLADAGLVGLPNAGKSTLISVISAARPKVADYPFTTLVPNLGVVKTEGFRSFVVADIPGLIRGAHQGAGLGIQFLRHVERTRVLAHLVDVSEYAGEDPVDAFETVRGELASFPGNLSGKRTIVIGTKIDIMGTGEGLEKLRRHAETLHLPFFALSAATGRGVEDLVRALSVQVEQA